VMIFLGLASGARLEAARGECRFFEFALKTPP